jgi:hypothetical protein
LLPFRLSTGQKLVLVMILLMLLLTFRFPNGEELV